MVIIQKILWSWLRDNSGISRSSFQSNSPSKECYYTCPLNHLDYPDNSMQYASIIILRRVSMQCMLATDAVVSPIQRRFATNYHISILPLQMQFAAVTQYSVITLTSACNSKKMTGYYLIFNFNIIVLHIVFIKYFIYIYPLFNICVQCLVNSRHKSNSANHHSIISGGER